MAWDLIVIGGGSAGLTATSVARKLGARVLLVEKRALGGDCLFTGCVPSKTLIRSAEVAHLMREAARFGLPAHAPTVDGAQVMARVKAVIARVAEHDSIARFTGPGAPTKAGGAGGAFGVSEVRLGTPRFVSPGELAFDGERERLTARAFLIATGSRPAVPPIVGLAEARPLTNESLFELDRIPRTLAVLGAGAVGLELGQAMQRLGARVTMLEAEERILPREDAEVSSLLRARLEAEGMVVHTHARVERVRRDGEHTVLQASSPSGPLEVRAEAVLVATGRRPNLEDLGLEAAGIAHDARKVRVDEELRTTNPRVWAAGDVAGNHLFTHTAGYEAAIAVRNALLPLASKVDYRAVPFATFTDPEVARVGLSEAEARAAHDHIEVHRSPMAAVDRALTDGSEDGFVKLIAVRGKLVGAHIVASHAGELIHPAVLAVKEQLKVSALAGMSWIYPSLSEGVRKASQSAFEQLLERSSVRTAVGLLKRLKRD